MHIIIFIDYINNQISANMIKDSLNIFDILFGNSWNGYSFKVINYLEINKMGKKKI